MHCTVSPPDTTVTGPLTSEGWSGVGLHQLGRKVLLSTPGVQPQLLLLEVASMVCPVHKGKWFFLVGSSIMCQLMEPQIVDLNCEDSDVCFFSITCTYVCISTYNVQKTAFTTSVCPPHSIPVSFDDSTAIDCHCMWCMRSYTKGV